MHSWFWYPSLHVIYMAVRYNSKLGLSLQRYPQNEVKTSADMWYALSASKNYEQHSDEDGLLLVQKEIAQWTRKVNLIQIHTHGETNL